MTDILETVRAVVQTQQPQNLQAIAWDIVGPNFWRGYAAMSALGGLLLARNLLQTVRRRDRIDALTLSRMIWLGGLILGSFVRLNSACEPLSAAFLVTAAVFTGVLINTRWCERPGTARQKTVGIIRDALYPPPRPEIGR